MQQDSRPESNRGQPRRRILSLAALATGGVLAGCLGGDSEDQPDSPPGDDGDVPSTPPGADMDVPEGSTFPRPEEAVPDTVHAELVTGELTQPTQLLTLPGHDHQWVLERGGQVRVLEDDGLVAAPVLDLGDRITVDEEYRFEMGLLGMALHPNFAENRRLFVRYSAPPREGTDPAAFSHTFVLAEFAAGPDGRTIDAASERTVLEIPQPEPRHQAGDLAFGPDGHLLVPAGDGGARPATYDHDQAGYVEDWYETNWGGPSQNTQNNLLGGLLRLDVDATPTEHPRSDPDAPESPDALESPDASESPDRAGGYAIPPDNPLVEWEGHREEYFAWGFRNPWRLTVHEGEYFVADVGEASWESIYHVGRGGNYGWNVREGSHCFYYDDAAGDETCPSSTPADVRNGEPLRDPIVEYPREPATSGVMNGIAVIGGKFYGGAAIPGLYGRYVFGDYFPTEAGTLEDGRLFVATPPSGPVDQEWETALVDVETLSEPPARIDPIHSFARDGDGELSVVTRHGVWRLRPAE